MPRRHPPISVSLRERLAQLDQLIEFERRVYFRRLTRSQLIRRLIGRAWQDHQQQETGEQVTSDEE